MAHEVRAKINTTIVEPKDLEIVVKTSTEGKVGTLLISKGSVGIAWSQLKVSSQQSHDLLVKGMPVYRVTGIGSRSVKIFIMRHGVDFEMSPEPRWSVHPPRR